MTSRADFPSFPNEVYLEILNKLDAWKDKRVLVNLALVNQFWRHQSQRTLFRHVGKWEYDGGRTSWKASSKLHMLFWECMLVDPTRLGSYVIEYTHPVQYNTMYGSNTYFIQKALKLATTGLPYMVNLKRLTFQPENNRRASFLRLLRNCTFQLESLAWMSSEEDADDLKHFLRAQRVLRHLDVEIKVPGGDAQCHDYLPTDSCPQLMSMSCNLDYLSFVLYRSNITALNVYRPSHEDIDITQDELVVLRRLTHLKVEAHLLSLGFPGQLLPNIILLNAGAILSGTPTYISQFPGLRVLVYNDLYIMPEEEFQSSYVPLCFQQCPRLERIIAHDFTRTYFTTFTATRAKDGAVLGVHSNVTHSEFNYIDPWWMAHNVDI